MNYRIIAAVSLAASLAALAACSSPQQMVTSQAATVAVSATSEHLSAANVARLQTLCGIVQPLAERAAAASSRAQQIVGQFGVAYCGKLLAGTVPSTTDSNTVTWLQGILGALRFV